MRRQLLFLAYAVMAMFGAAAPALANVDTGSATEDDNGWGELDSPPVSDDELASMRGGFELPNGVALAMSITSDTHIDGHLVLRTVLTVDDSAHVAVFGRQGASNDEPSQTIATSQPMTAATGVSVIFDRRSGLQSVTPTFGVSSGTNVTVSSAPQDAATAGLTHLALVADGAPIATDDGLVTLTTTSTGSQVTLHGDQLGVAHLVGQNIATAIVNSANDRTIDTVTNVSIDLSGAAAYSYGSAMLQIDSMSQDVANGLAR